MAELGRGSAAAGYSVLQVAVLALLLALECCALLSSAATWTVGGSQGWDIRIDYTAWAASQTFATGDVLFFPYDSGAHNVVEVNKAGYDACSAASPVATYTDGNTNVTLNSAGTFYFLCSFPSHCTAGMKLAVAVGAASAPSPSTSVGTPPPSPSPPAPPPSAPVSTPSPSPPAPPPSSPLPSTTPSVGSAPASTPTPSPAANAPVPSSTPSPVNAPVPTPGSVGAPPLASATPVSSPPPPNSAPSLSSATSLAAALFFLSAALLAAL